MQSVREATFDVFREYGLTTLFANPGSTEIDLLADLPDDLRFVLGLHESSVVGMATGWAIGRDEPALAILHTTAGLGNAVGALATARVNRAPARRRRRPAGPAPSRVRAVSRGQAARARGRVSGVGRRARPSAGRARRGRARLPRGGHRARAGARDRADGRLGRRGGRARTGAPRRAASCARGRPDRDAVAELAELIAAAQEPGARRRSRRRRRPRPGARSSRWPSGSRCPVWQESFSARAGFPQDHPLFAGHLPADRPRLRQTLAPHDAVLVVGGAGVPPVPVPSRAVRRAGDAGRA